MSTAGVHAHTQLADRLRSRRGEIEQALLTRVYGIGNPAETGDSVYLDGFRIAAAAAVDFAIDTVESAGPAPPVPPVFLSQARLAARNGVRFDTVLRRYAAGHAILADFVTAGIGRDMVRAEFRALLAASSSAFDRLLLRVGEEYTEEVAKCSRKPRDSLKRKLVEGLLAGELVDSHHLAYPLEGWHIGLVLEGDDVGKHLHKLALEVDRGLLVVEARAQIAWAWLGGGTRIDAAEVVERVRFWQLGVKVAVGEPATGVSGWRLSHKQAIAVLPFCDGEKVQISRYADKGLLASVQRDQVLVESLRSLYLEPLANGNEPGDVLCQTLRAYFAADCNVSSAASALKVHRQTVTSRLRAAEQRLGRSISQSGLELNIALRLAPEA